MSTRATPSARYLRHIGKPDVVSRPQPKTQAKKPPTISKAVRRSAAYVLSRYEPELNTGCWLWTGGTDRDGYGTQWVAGKVVAAHRYFYERLVGPIPSGLELRHRCDTPACVNPAHLSLGTHAENMRDAWRRGRALWNGWRERAA